MVIKCSEILLIFQLAKLMSDVKGHLPVKPVVPPKVSCKIAQCAAMNLLAKCNKNFDFYNFVYSFIHVFKFLILLLWWSQCNFCNFFVYFRREGVVSYLKLITPFEEIRQDMHAILPCALNYLVQDLEVGPCLLQFPRRHHLPQPRLQHQKYWVILIYFQN